MPGVRREPTDDPMAAIGLSDVVPIGTGGSSVVYRARQAAFDRLVALKVLSTPLGDDRSRRRFERELSLAGRLSGHPNVVTVFASGFLPDGRGYVLMELAAGGSLADRLAIRGPFPVRDVVAIGIKMAGVLELAAHDGITHRDVKPGNILLTRFGEPALSDFGIAVVAGEVTGTTQALTPVHAAPEVLEGRPVDGAADQWSLASTLHTLLAGRAPFAVVEGDGLLAGMLRILNDPTPTIPRTDIPPSLVDVLQRALSKAAADRWPSPSDFGRALQAVEVEMGWPGTLLPIVQVPEAGPAAGSSAGPSGASVLSGASSVLSDGASGDGVGAVTTLGGSIWPLREGGGAEPEPGAGGSAPAGLAGPSAPGPAAASGGLAAPRVPIDDGVDGHTQHFSRRDGPAGPPAAAPAPPAGLAASGPPAAPAPSSTAGSAPVAGSVTGPRPDSPLAQAAADESTRHFQRRPTVEPEAAPPEPPARSNRLLWIGGSAAAVIVVVVALVVVLSTGSSPRPKLDPARKVLQAPSANPSTLAPKNVQVVAEQSTSVTLSWNDPAGGPYAYVVQVSGQAPQVATGQTQTVVQALDPTQGYCFTVGTVYAVGSPSYASPVCIRGGSVTSTTLGAAPTTAASPPAPTTP